MIKEAENKRKSASDLIKEIESAKKPKLFGGMDNYYWHQLEEMQRKAQNVMYNLEQNALINKSIKILYFEIRKINKVWNSYFFIAFINYILKFFLHRERKWKVKKINQLNLHFTK